MPHAANVPDVVQEVSLRLWKWREKYFERTKGMANADWKSFTARTAHNEINRYFSNRVKRNEVPINEAVSLSTETPEGNVPAEIFSLVVRLWQEICSLTLRQRRALLLHSPDLIIYLMQCGISDGEIANRVGLDEGEWESTRMQLPLTDAQILALSDVKKGIAGRRVQSVKKARYEARVKLEGVLKR